MTPRGLVLLAAIAVLVGGVVVASPLAGAAPGVASHAENGRTASSPARVRCPVPGRYCVGCKLAGLRYLGTTSQGREVCFTVSRDRKALREYSFGFKCRIYPGWAAIEPSSEVIRVDGNITVGTGHGSGGAVTTIRRDGTFSDIPLEHGVFKGKLEALRAAGILRQQYPPIPVGGAAPVCDTGTVRWTAKRTTK